MGKLHQELRSYKELRSYLLIALMALTLVGVQFLQSSPLHDHTQHSVECAVYHLSFSDDALFDRNVAVAAIARSVPYSQYLQDFYSFGNPSPYQGRAPPLAFS